MASSVRPVGSQPRTTNGYAVASLVLGIVCLYGIGSILALIFGYRARREIDESAGSQTGRGMATAGVVLGWIGIGLMILVVVLLIVAAAGSSSSDGMLGANSAVAVG